MTDHTHPIWVRDPDGNVVPFEADQICQSLFAATEELGCPDAFLARELTDGVVHFLSEEANGSLPSAADLPELVAKVVREFRQPKLAQRFEELSRRPVPSVAPSPAADPRRHITLPSTVLSRVAAAEKWTAFSLTNVYPKNLVAARDDGLLTLWGLDHPLELAGSVLGPGSRPDSPGQGLLESLDMVREHTGGFVAIDSPEYALSAVSGEPRAVAAEYGRELRAGLSANGLAAIVNLNVSTPPTWNRELGAGPLFAEVRQPVDPSRVMAMADALCDQLLADVRDRGPTIDVGWHLGGPDFGKEKIDRLERLAGFVADGVPISFPFDRPRRPIALAPGLDRTRPAVLTAVGVHLPRLAKQIPTVTGDGFLQKLGTLARLARSAGHARQDFLRRHARPAVTRGFLLDRARLVVVPIGLEAVVRELSGGRICDAGSGEGFARQVLAKLREALTHEKPRTMDAGLNSAPPVTPLCHLEDGNSNKMEGVMGLTPWDADATAQQQLQAGAALQVVADGGTATVVTAKNDCVTYAALLKYAWTQTNIVGMQFARRT